jgi:hypothetical protein
MEDPILDFNEDSGRHWARDIIWIRSPTSEERPGAAIFTTATWLTLAAYAVLVSI